ncbi:hypothetical protein QAD02_006741 [Eretmocerus hayati]|uniref:Uncharacterized protein n=1 Tax=Eretmocerus hayati TaxID=131215 RepID=A0ACC2N1Q6_9HYME|nr:hypothetical protein QAD02_006741 [Eretmocerus hayati]
MSRAGHVELHVEGSLTFECDVPTQGIHDLFQRSAAIMAAHLLYKPNDPFNSYLNQEHLKSITKEQRKLMRKSLITVPREIDEQERKIYGGSLITEKLLLINEAIKACVELAVGEEYFALVKYQIQIRCMPHNETDPSCNIGQEPHYQWNEMICAIFDAHYKDGAALSME